MKSVDFRLSNIAHWSFHHLEAFVEQRFLYLFINTISVSFDSKKWFKVVLENTRFQAKSLFAQKFQSKYCSFHFKLAKFHRKWFVIYLVLFEFVIPRHLICCCFIYGIVKAWSDNYYNSSLCVSVSKWKVWYFVCIWGSSIHTGEKHWNH